jgi:hypothetical protein
MLESDYDDIEEACSVAASDAEATATLEMDCVDCQEVSLVARSSRARRAFSGALWLWLD